MSDERDARRDGAAFGGAVAGAVAAAPEAAAADAMRDGMEPFLEAAERLLQVGTEQKKGNLFEFIEAAKFNAEAARRGSELHASVTAAQGRPTDPVDIEILRGDTVLRSVQAKASKSTTFETSSLSDPKYDGMEKLVPSDHAETVQRKAAALAERYRERGESTADSFADTARRVKGELGAEGVSSGGTSLSETYDAVRNPSLYALQQEVRAVAREATVAGATAATAGAVMGGAISALSQSLAVSRGELTVREATARVAVDSAKAGATSGAAGALGAVIRHGADKAGVEALTRSNVATAVAAGMIRAGVTVYAFAKGEITAEQAAEQLGQNGCSTASGVFVGAAAGALFGPVGAVAGSMAGYILAASIYQSSLAVLRQARLAEAEAERVVALCDEAVRALDAQRRAFEERLEVALQQREAAFSSCLDAIDAMLAGDSPAAAAEALGEIAMMCGRTLKFQRFEDFDDFMLNSDEPLVI